MTRSSQRPDIREAAAKAANPDAPPDNLPAPQAQRGPAAIAMLEAQRDELAKALPPGLSPERFVRIATTALRTNPLLMELGETPEGKKSLMAAIHRCAQMGLEPNSDLGHCYLLPFRMNQKLQLQFILGYKGILEMSRRSGRLKRIDVHEVYENDDFEITYGLNGVCRHAPTLKGPRGPIVCYYGYAEFTDGGYYYMHMTLEDIEERKQRSASVKAKKRSPWDTDPVAMSKKTVYRAMAPNLPLAAAEVEALAMDDGVIDGEGEVSFIDVGAVPHTPEPAAEPAPAEEQGELVTTGAEQ